MPIFDIKKGIASGKHKSLNYACQRFFAVKFYIVFPRYRSYNEPM